MVNVTLSVRTINYKESLLTIYVLFLNVNRYNSYYNSYYH